jgi:chromosome segregation ATPase
VAELTKERDEAKTKADDLDAKYKVLEKEVEELRGQAGNGNNTAELDKQIKKLEEEKAELAKQLKAEQDKVKDLEVKLEAAKTSEMTFKDILDFVFNYNKDAAADQKIVDVASIGPVLKKAQDASVADLESLNLKNKDMLDNLVQKDGVVKKAEEKYAAITADLQKYYEGLSAEEKKKNKALGEYLKLLGDEEKARKIHEGLAQDKETKGKEIEELKKALEADKKKESDLHKKLLGELEQAKVDENGNVIETAATPTLRAEIAELKKKIQGATKDIEAKSTVLKKVVAQHAAAVAAHTKINDKLTAAKPAGSAPATEAKTALDEAIKERSAQVELLKQNREAIEAKELLQLKLAKMAEYHAKNLSPATN